LKAVAPAYLAGILFSFAIRILDVEAPRFLPRAGLKKGDQMASYCVGDLTRREILKMSAALAGTGVALSNGLAAAAAAPEGTMTWGVHITLASRWLDPAETEGIITPFMVLYGLHDALVKPMPAGINTPCLAESWTQSPDGVEYEFVLRKGTTFHNGEP